MAPFMLIMVFVFFDPKSIRYIWLNIFNEIANYIRDHKIKFSGNCNFVSILPAFATPTTLLLPFLPICCFSASTLYCCNLTPLNSCDSSGVNYVTNPKHFCCIDFFLPSLAICS